MKKSWTTLKRIITASPRQHDLFLSLIDEDGRIASANATMLRNLELEDPRTVPANFFDLVHPIHREEFRKLIHTASTVRESLGIELYIRNGQYHPMKWEVNYIDDGNDASNTYLCLGYKILDEERQERFNQLVWHHHELIIDGFSGIIFQDRDGELIAANQQATAIFSTTLERLYQLKDIRSLWNDQWVITDEQGNVVKFDQTPFMQAMSTGRPQRKTLVIRLLNGEERWIVFHSQPVFEKGNGEQLIVATSIIDVTYERHLSQQLKDREALLGTFLQKTPYLAWVVDEDARLLFASQAFYSHFALEERESMGKRVMDLVPAKITEALYAKHVQVLETGEPVETTEEIRWADGTVEVAYITIFSIPTLSGKKRLGGQAVSLPDKSRVEKELKQMHERLLHFSKASTDAIWEWDMQTGQIYRNETLMEMIGYQLEHSKGLSWWLRRIHPDDRNRVADKVKDATDHHRQSWEDEYRFKCADGNYKHVRDKGFVVYENGLPVKMIGSLHNVSDLKELESELADERLLRQKAISETVIRAQEEERSRIGHELHDNVNQILSTAKLFVSALNANNVQQQLKDKSLEYLQMAVDEIRKLSKELVTPQLKEESLAENISRLVDDIGIADALQIHFNYDREPDELSPGKKITLFRVVQEQLKNILKHSKASAVNISLETRDGQVELQIEDDGCGFDPRQTTQGIGLSNIHERTEFYNGHVSLQSAPGKGCRLTVSIPVS